MQHNHFNMICLMGQFHKQLGYRLGAIKSISLISLHDATRGPTPSLLSSLSPLPPHLSPLPHFLICSCNPPHPSPSALLLFLSPSPSYLTISSSCQPLPQIMLHDSSPKSYSYYTKERREGWDVHWDLRIKLYLLQCIPTLKAGAQYAIPKEYHWVRTCWSFLQFQIFISQAQ